MRQLNKLIWILIIFNGFSNNLSASDILRTDSIKVVQIVNGFYDWYIRAIKIKNNTDYKPRFVESENGMTTLDFSIYIENLKTNGFSDSLIFREKKSYSECIENLGKVKFSNFKKTIFIDLDEYEQVNCDFGNYYRWTGGQEPIDGIRIKDIKLISEDFAWVSIDYFVVDSKDTRHYLGKNSLILKRLNNDWQINSVDSWNYI